MKILLRCTVWLFCGFLVASAAAKVTLVDPVELMASSEQKRATELITHFIRRYHYRNRQLDNDLSEAIYDRYLEALDPNRIYFLASDIEEFSRYQYRLDDALMSAELMAPFEMFRRMRQRLEERSRFAVQLLNGEIDFSVDEVFLLDRSEAPWAGSVDDMNEIWRKRVKNDALSLHLAGKNQMEISDLLRKRYERLATRIGQFDSDDVYQTFINSYTASIEPHTSYFSRRASDNFKIRMSLSLEGIGAALQTENEHTVVRRIIPGGPADLSKQLSADDRITGVGQNREPIVDVVGWRLADVVDLIRGPKGSLVRLEVLPKGTPPDGRSRVVELVRNTIKLEEQAAQKSVIELSDDSGPARIAVIKVPTFYTDFDARENGKREFRSTTRDVRRLIKELEEEGINGIVIDLRGNGGGSLAEATELSGLFIRSGPIVQVRDTSGRVTVNDDPDPKLVYAGPLAVLVDRNSASASEIFAGAIQDYRRGIVLGEPTFGKGTVQRLVDLSRFSKDEEANLGQLKFTIAQFFRINGESTQHRGVVPDIVFPTATDIEEIGERSLENALPWASVRPARFIASGLNPKAVEAARLRHEARVRADAGFMYLLDEADAVRRARDQKMVSLLAAKRRAVREKNEQESLERLNRYRMARSLPVLESLEDTGDEDTEREDEDQEDENVADDVLRKEAAHILGDLIKLSRREPLMTLNQDSAREPPAAQP
jgi:carboxyl-terminal processing protease